MNPIYPNKQFKSFCYIKSVVANPNIIVGDYSYYDDSVDGPELFEKHVTHFYQFLGDKLIIGICVLLIAIVLLIIGFIKKEELRKKIILKESILNIKLS